MKKERTVVLSIDGYGSAGEGVGRLDGQAVFVKGALRGETCRVRLDKVGKRAAWGTVVEVLAPSPHRIAPDCPQFPTCGGCALRHMDYAEELRYKRGRVEDALRRIGGWTGTVETIHGAAEPDRYRNKIQFPVADGPRIGFYRARSHEVIDSENPFPFFALILISFFIFFMSSFFNAEEFFPAIFSSIESILFQQKITGFSAFFKNSTSSFVSPDLLSHKYKMTSASSVRFLVSSTPCASITSSVSRSPAVSKSRTGSPPKSTQLSSQSRVVPSMSLTIARSSFKIALNKDDFPAFVLPQSTIRAPS